MATHSSILAWRIPWTQGPGGLQSMRLQKIWHSWATNAWHDMSLTSSETILLDCIMIAVKSACIKKYLPELARILKMEESKQHFWCVVLCYFKKDKNSTERWNRICVEGVTDQTCPKWFVKFCTGDSTLDDSTLQGWVNELKLIAIKLRH